MTLLLLPSRPRGGTVHVQLGMRFGDEKSLTARETAAEIAGGLLIAGTKTKSRQQIQDEMDRPEGATERGRRRDRRLTPVSSDRANLPRALRLAAEVLREPSSPKVNSSRRGRSGWPHRSGQDRAPVARAPGVGSAHLKP